MAKAIDKIRNYIKRETKKGKLYPGKRLPSYSELQEHFGYSYMTIQKSMNKLCSEKIVDIINGKGCYIATPKKLKIVFYIPSTTIDFNSLQRLFSKYLDKSLRVEVELHDYDWHRYDLKQPDNETHAVIISASFNAPFSLPGLTSFRNFNDFAQVSSQLNTFNSNIDPGFYVPFYSSTSQLGVNLDLLEGTGFDLGDLTSDFSWWDELTVKCKEVHPPSVVSSYFCDQEYPWWFGYFRPLLFSLLINERQSSQITYEKPLFNTASGAKLLDIIKSYKGTDPSSDFNDNNSILDLSAGSWLTLQHKIRKDFLVKNFAFKPYEFEGRKICLPGLCCIQTYMDYALDNDERDRIWEVIKVMTSKPFQVDFCNMSGMLSARKDISPDDYIWNNRPDFASFIPQCDDIIISSNIFSSHVLASFAALIEQYVFYDADKQNILQQLDKKLVFNLPSYKDQISL